MDYFTVFFIHYYICIHYLFDTFNKLTNYIFIKDIKVKFILILKVVLKKYY